MNGLVAPTAQAHILHTHTHTHVHAQCWRRGGGRYRVLQLLGPRGHGNVLDERLDTLWPFPAPATEPATATRTRTKDTDKDTDKKASWQVFQQSEEQCHSHVLLPWPENDTHTDKHTQQHGASMRACSSLQSCLPSRLHACSHAQPVRAPLALRPECGPFPQLSRVDRLPGLMRYERG